MKLISNERMLAHILGKNEWMNERLTMGVCVNEEMTLNFNKELLKSLLWTGLIDQYTWTLRRRILMAKVSEWMASAQFMISSKRLGSLPILPKAVVGWCFRRCSYKQIDEKISKQNWDQKSKVKTANLRLSKIHHCRSVWMNGDGTSHGSDSSIFTIPSWMMAWVLGAAIEKQEKD